jgi:selenocysteine lyase/cysteine desulfurase
MAATYDVEAARAQFPALQQEQVFMDNAGEI